MQWVALRIPNIVGIKLKMPFILFLCYIFRTDDTAPTVVGGTEL